MVNNGKQSMIIKWLLRQWFWIIELKEDTFLDLEDIQEYENSGDHTRVQGRYQGKPRRGI